MRKQVVPTLFLVFSTSLDAAPGEPGGAYGGDTRGGNLPLRFEAVDRNRDGIVDKVEARDVGIERFWRADRDHSGSLDKSEFGRLMKASGFMKPRSESR